MSIVPSILVLAIAAAVVATLILFILAARQPQVMIPAGGVQPDAGGAPHWSKVFRVARWAVLAYAVVMAAVTLVSIANAFIGDLTMTVPVEEFWPEVDPRFTLEPSQATIVGGGFATASLTLTGLSVPVRILSAVEALLIGGMAVTIALAIATIFRYVGQARPFTKIMAKMMTAAAIAVAAGGVVAQIIGGIAGSMASTQALFIPGWSAVNLDDATTDPGLPLPAVLIEFNFAPVAILLALAALAALFHHAARLQRETDGLV